MTFSKHFPLLILLITLIYSCSIAQETTKANTNTLSWDKDYADLEQINKSEVQNWLKAQTEHSNKTLSVCSGVWELYDLMLDLNRDNPFKIRSQKYSDNGEAFYLKKNNREERYKLYHRLPDEEAEEKLLLDPYQFDSSSILTYFEPSWDGTRVIVGFSQGDSEFCRLYAVDTRTKEVLPGMVDLAFPFGFGGIQWLPDNTRFTYTRFPHMDAERADLLSKSKIMLCTTEGSVAITDTIFSAELLPELDIPPAINLISYIFSSRSEYLYVELASTNIYRDAYLLPLSSLGSGTLPYEKAFSEEDKIFPMSGDGEHFYYRTAKYGDNFSLCRTSEANPDFEQPTILVPEDPNKIIGDFELLSSSSLLYTRQYNSVDCKLYQLDSSGQSTEIIMPRSAGNIVSISKGRLSKKAVIDVDGWTTPGTMYAYDLDTKELTLDRLNYTSAIPFLDSLVIEEVEVASHDGALVPLSIIRHQDAELDGTNRVLLDVYGAYGISLTPLLDRHLIPWIKMGGIFAVAHVRGGEEKGNDWHRSATKEHKYHSWKDLNACADYLIDKDYTSSEFLTAKAASAGAICLGRAITERPELYRAAVLRVGFLNPARRAELFLDHRGLDEFGDYRIPSEREGLINMDPFLNLKEGEPYPAMLMLAGINDSRVKIWHPAKFTAKAQDYSSSSHPILFDVDFGGGHGVDASDNKRYITSAKTIGFLLWQTGHPDFQPKEKK